MLEHGIESLCCIPLTTRQGELGTLNLASKRAKAFAPPDIGFLEQVAGQVAVALDNARSYREIAQLTDKLANEKLYLEDEIRSELNFEEIVGESPALKRVLAQARTVAPSDATVLILGDTGTGKELIARAIHRMSSRKDRGFGQTKLRRHSHRTPGERTFRPREGRFHRRHQPEGGTSGTGGQGKFVP
jgi:formate hydrogenlyase transcriptional activator